MAWSLEIHHFDVVRKGDATLILAQDSDTNTSRSCLIDGGLTTYAPTLTANLKHALNGRALDVIVCTHYDEDHALGLIQILLDPDLPTVNTRVYDQGWPTRGLDNLYNDYCNAVFGYGKDRHDSPYTLRAYFIVPPPIPLPDPPPPLQSRLQRQRITNRNWNDDTIRHPRSVGVGSSVLPPGGVGAIDQPASMLLGREVLWDQTVTGIAPPAGAPLLTCIAVNGYILQPMGQMVGPIGVSGGDPKNQRSLAFQLLFNNFKYYVGGDIEENQEDYIQGYLNPTNDAAGRVLAFKPSHHGANTATSRDFVSRIRPDAAFISCGTANQFKPNPHPAPRTVNVLDGFPEMPALVMQGTDFHTPPPPPPPYQPVASYLTGYQHPDWNPPTSVSADLKFYVAGDPRMVPPVSGTILLRVSDAQSRTNVRGMLGLVVGAAASQCIQALGGSTAMATRTQGFCLEAMLRSGDVAIAAAASAIIGVGNKGQAMINTIVETIATTADNNRTPEGYRAAIPGALYTALTQAGLDVGTAAAIQAAAQAAAINRNNVVTTADAVAQAVLTAGTVTNRAAGAAGAASGVALSGGYPDPAELITLQVLTNLNASSPIQAAERVAQVGQAAYAPGLFNVSFYDLFRVDLLTQAPTPGFQNYTHH